MGTNSPDPAEPTDLADALTSDDASELLSLVIEQAGGVLLEWSVNQVHSRSSSFGIRTSVSYQAKVDWSGEIRDEILGGTTVAPGSEPAKGVIQLTDGTSEIQLWLYPNDPWLPGLASAASAANIAKLVTDFGGRQVSPADVKFKTVAYRPRKRAVIQAQGEDWMLYVKVLRPSRVKALHDRHTMLFDAGLPVPQSLGWTDNGVLVLEPLIGPTMRTAFEEGLPLPSGQDILDLLAKFPADAMKFPSRTSWTSGARTYGETVAQVLPDSAEWVLSMVDEIIAAVGDLPNDRPVHGDLYDAQLILGDGKIIGLLDVDSVGPGRLADDLACLLGHGEVMVLIWPHIYDHVRPVLDEWLATFDEACDPAELRYRIAGVLLSLATGPYRVQEPNWQAHTLNRLEMVQHWINAAKNYC